MVYNTSNKPLKIRRPLGPDSEICTYVAPGEGIDSLMYPHEAELLRLHSIINRIETNLKSKKSKLKLVK